MIRRTIAVLMILACGPAGRAAVTLRGGLWFGPQTINDAKIKATYGEHSVFQPHLEAQVWKGLSLGAGYEVGYSGRGTIGLYSYPTSLTMSGFHMYAAYELRLKKFAPFARLGLGVFSYRQTVDNPFLADMNVDASKTAVPWAVGLKFYPSDLIFLGIEAGYTALTVKPFDIEVDLGGWRLAAGLGFALNL